MQFKKYANLLGFTPTEFKVLLFLSVVFICGLLIKYFNIESYEYKNFDYSTEDSIFLASDSINAELPKSFSDKDEENNINPVNNRNKFFKIKKKEIPGELSININSADKEEFMTLPGIGEKTAIQIIEIRTKKGKFSNIEELKEVKGIRNAKLEKIRKYIYVK